MTCKNSPGVNFGVYEDASAKGDGVGSMSFDVELEVEGEVGLPKGKHRRRLAGR